MEKTDEKFSRDNEKELSEDELNELMGAYKKELAHIYKMASAKKALMVRKGMPCLESVLAECDRDMRTDIERLKDRYGIHY